MGASSVLLLLIGDNLGESGANDQSRLALISWLLHMLTGDWSRIVCLMLWRDVIGAHSDSGGISTTALPDTSSTYAQIAVIDETKAIRIVCACKHCALNGSQASTYGVVVRE